MLDWIIPTGLIALFSILMVYSNMRLGKPRRDGRPNKLPWGFIMVFCVLGIFLIPMLYLLVRRNISRKQPHAAGHLEEPRSTSPASGSEGEAAR